MGSNNSEMLTLVDTIQSKSMTRGMTNNPQILRQILRSVTLSVLERSEALKVVKMMFQENLDDTIELLKNRETRNSKREITSKVYEVIRKNPEGKYLMGFVTEYPYDRFEIKSADLDDPIFIFYCKVGPDDGRPKVSLEKAFPDDD